MKNQFLLFAVAAAFLLLHRQTNTRLCLHSHFRRLSPNGNYAVSVDPYGGSLILLNLVDGTSETLPATAIPRNIRQA